MARPNGKPTSVEMKKIEEVSGKIRTMESELNEIFPAREYAIHQIMLALLSREHVMLFGKKGTGKSDITQSVFRAIPDSTIFSIALTKFMNESSFIGLPNPKLMQETGKIVFEKEGGILEADFAELDEFLDASSVTLRTLLGVLNERLFKRGRQSEVAELQTAIASTNGDPYEQVKEHDELDAVEDRFLFWSKVDYLTEKEDRIKMYHKYLTGGQPKTTITLEDIKFLSGMVVNPCQITDMEIIEFYDDVLEAVSHLARGEEISDRRKCKLTTLMEANAIYHGRWEVILDDVMAIKYGILDGGEPEKITEFDSIVSGMIEAFKEERNKANPDEAYLDLLGKYDEEITEITGNDFDQLTLDELSDAVRKLKDIHEKVERITPGIVNVQMKRTAMMENVDKLISQAVERFMQSSQVPVV